MGDLNWDWLSPSRLQEICDALQLSQLIKSLTRLNTKDMDKSTLIDVILTNCPFKYCATGIFCNDVSDHCVVACVRKCKLVKPKPRFIFLRNYKRFNEQVFMHGLYNSDLYRICEMVDVELAWECFKTPFIQFIDKRPPEEIQNQWKGQPMVCGKYSQSY